MQPSISRHIDTSKSHTGKALSIAFMFLPLAAAGYLVYQNMTADQLIAPWPWMGFWAGCIALLAVAPWRPAVGIVAFVAAAYLTPRYAPAFDPESGETLYGVMMSLHTLNIICGLSLIGWMIGSMRQRLKPKNPGLLVWPFLVFILWLVVCGVMMITGGTAWDPHPNHHPESYLQAFVMFILAGQLLRTDVEAVGFAFLLGGVICIRWALSGAAGVELEGDIPVLGVMAIPVLFIGVKASWSGFTKLILVGIVVAMVVLVIMTKNRNAMVALVVLLPALWITAKQKLPVFILSLPVLIIAGIVFAQSSNWKRFEALLTGGDDANSANQRLVIWQSGLNMTMKKPLFGVGPGNFHNEVAKYRSAQSLQLSTGTNEARIDDDEYAAHNSVIHIMGETGFIGGALYLALFVGAAVMSLLIKPATDSRDLPHHSWPFPVLKLLFPAIVVYLAAGVFISRQDMVLAYLLVGWFSAVAATHRTEMKQAAG